MMALSGLVLGYPGNSCTQPFVMPWECIRAEGLASLVVTAAVVAFISRARRPVCEGMYGLAAGFGALIAQLFLHLQSLGTHTWLDALFHVGVVFFAMFAGCIVGFMMPFVTRRLGH